MVNFNFSYAPGTSLQQMVGFETAGRVWSSFLTDNVTLNIYAGVSSNLPANVIGGALPGIKTHQSYSSVVNGLVKDATSADDAIAVGSLNRGTTYSARFDLFYGWGGFNSGVTMTTQNINLTSANAKALGLVGAADSSLDGVVLFGGLQGTNYAWNYDYARSGSAPTNSLDFLSTAIHEIGHILGFVSSVDKPGWLDSRVGLTDLTQYITNLADRVSYTTPLDLFRYSNAAFRINDLSYGSNGSGWGGESDKFFSLDKGRTAIAAFATGADTSLGGDGHQASHWKDGTLGVLDPTLATGERLSISRTDLRAFDAIGWNLKSTTGSLNLDLSALKSQSDQALAERLGTTVASLYANVATSATKLSIDQSSAVDAMIQDSQVYDWGIKLPIGPILPSPLGQVLDLLQSQTVYGSFDTLDDQADSAGGADPSHSVSLAAKVKLSAATLQHFAAYLPAPGSTKPSKLSFKELSQVLQSITSPISAEQGWGKGLRLFKNVAAESRTSVSNSSRSRSTSRKFSFSQDSIAVDTVDVLAL